MKITPARILIFGFTLLTISCGSKQDVDKVGEAQYCLDGLGSSPSASDVNDCVDKVSGVESVSAYGIRCAGYFIKEGFADPKKYTSAFDQLSGSGTSNFMGLLTFTSARSITTDTTNSSNAFNTCLRSEGKAATMISAFGYMAMALYQYLYSTDAGTDACSPTPAATGYDLADCITQYKSDVGNIAALAALGNASTAVATAATLQSSLGSVIVATYNISCTTGVGANKELCTTLKRAIDNAGGQNNTRGVAVQFVILLGVQ